MLMNINNSINVRL